MRAKTSSTGVVPLVIALGLSLALGLAKCQEIILLSQTGLICTNVSVLSCSFYNLTFVIFEDFDVDREHFNVLSSNEIAMNPDYEEFIGENVYNLKISNAIQHNGSVYRCYGYDEKRMKQHSKPWTLSISACAATERNDTEPADDETSVGASGYMLVWSTPVFSAVLFICVVIAATGSLSAVVRTCYRKRREDTELNGGVVRVEADGHEANSDFSVTAERKALTRVNECNSSLITKAQQDDRDLKTFDIVYQASSSTHRGTEDHSYFHDESSEVELPASVQVDENGLVNDRDSPVLPGMNRDLTTRPSTYAVPGFSGHSIPPKMTALQDESDLISPHPKHTKASDTRCHVSVNTNGVTESGRQPNLNHQEESIQMQSIPAVNTFVQNTPLPIPPRVHRLQMPTGTALYLPTFGSESNYGVLPAPVQVEADGHEADRDSSVTAAIHNPPPDGATGGQVISMEIEHAADVLEALGQKVNEKWRQFGTFLHFEASLLDRIESENSKSFRNCMLDLVTKWFHRYEGSSELPRTWQTVVKAVSKLGEQKIAEELAKKYGVSNKAALDLILQLPKSYEKNDSVLQASSNTSREVDSGAAGEVLICAPDDLSDVPLQSPQVASNNDTAEAIQIAGEVVKYDSVRLQLNYSCLQRHVNEPFIHRRSDYGTEDVHMQGNPAYEPITSALVEAHPLQLSTGEELCESNTAEDVPMQGNPAYEPIGLTYSS